MNESFWIPESPTHSELYAADPKKGGCPGANCTGLWRYGLHFPTKEECQKWCDEHPIPAFVPVEHGMMG